MACLDDEGCDGGGHDEKENDISFQLRFPLEILGRKHDEAIERENAANKNGDLVDFNHEVPRAPWEFRNDFLGKLIPDGQLSKQFSGFPFKARREASLTR